MGCSPRSNTRSPRKTPNGNALPREERDEKIAELEAEIMDLEREEEATIMDAATVDVSISRRSDASPPAVLGIAPLGSEMGLVAAE
jgi:hypothetical protein